MGVLSLRERVGVERERLFLCATGLNGACSCSSQPKSLKAGTKCSPSGLVALRGSKAAGEGSQPGWGAQWVSLLGGRGDGMGGLDGHTAAQ